MSEVKTIIEMKEVIENRVIELVMQFAETYGDIAKYAADFPKEINYDKKGEAAGSCHFNDIEHEGQAVLSFNPVIMKDNWEQFDQTVIHEVAHFCTYLLKGLQFNKASKHIWHGADWKRMMSFFGAKTERCHTYNTSGVKKTRRVKRFEYKCSCQTHQISSIIHNRMVNGARTYSCRSCRTKIEFAG